MTTLFSGSFCGLTGSTTIDAAASCGVYPMNHAPAKSGTVTDFAGAWFIGYTPQLAAASMVVDPVKPQKDPLNNVVIGGHHYGAIFGATLPGPIWQQAMKDALE